LIPLATQPPPASKKMLWAGRILSGWVVVMLLFSGVMKLAKPASLAQEFARLGYQEQAAFGIGILELACVVVYLIPRTAVLGAILLAGYLGGAIATHVRISDPFIPPLVGGVLVWAGLYFRDERLRALIPLKR
ncbi:MAG: DoxX family protein, partial [Blastocatellia bacterium]